VAAARGPGAGGSCALALTPGDPGDRRGTGRGAVVAGGRSPAGPRGCPLRGLPGSVPQAALGLAATRVRRGQPPSYAFNGRWTRPSPGGSGCARRPGRAPLAASLPGPWGGMGARGGPQNFWHKAVGWEPGSYSCPEETKTNLAHSTVRFLFYYRCLQRLTPLNCSLR